MPASRAADHELADRVSFEGATAEDFPNSYDRITSFDCLHDMSDPAGAAARALAALAPATAMLVEPAAGGALEENLNAVGATYYGFSTLSCTPRSLSKEVGRALGAQAGEARSRVTLTGAGFGTFRRVADTPFDSVFEARA